MRIVLDSNVIMAAFAARGLCNALFEHCLENHDIFLCEDILSEISEKLIKKIRLSKPISDKIINYLRSHAHIVEPEKVSPKACRDKNDLMVLGSALKGKADYIITGDKDLLIINIFQGIKIVNPRSFWNKMKKLK